MNGCICCTVRGDLSKVLKKIHKKIEKFDGVIIETTGLADPAPVAQTFFVDDTVEKLYKLDGIITVVDAKHILPHLNEKKPDGVENEAVEQLAFADRVLLNKVDLVKDEKELEKVEKSIKAINATAPIFKCTNSVVHPKHLINIGSFDLSRTLEKDPEFLDTEAEHEHDTSVSSVSCKFEGELNHNKLQMWIGKLIQTKANDLYRYKGVLAVKGIVKKFVFQGVHMLFSGGFDTYKQRWKEGEKRECRFVFIGKNLDKKALKDGFMDCKAKDELRFKVGDLVEARCDKWLPGKIAALWDGGNPYRIELEGDHGECWGPIDDENFVRARTVAGKKRKSAE
mmetsp:Transcript_17313/g.24070  ORF Transcript_17313/g.24070 Transcript_17313/m.24070 type:complete len:339 (+) Transcript_17313:301-1317(+)